MKKREAETNCFDCPIIDECMSRLVRSCGEWECLAEQERDETVLSG